MTVATLWWRTCPRLPEWQIIVMPGACQRLGGPKRLPPFQPETESIPSANR